MIRLVNSLTLYQLGPKYGYSPESKKTILIIDSTKNEANVLFRILAISVVRGHRFLLAEVLNQSKIVKWTACKYHQTEQSC